MDEFIAWFKSAGGEISPDVSLHKFPDEEGGRGLVAVKEVQVGETLFSIPRTLLLSPRTCQLPQLIGAQDWKRLNLHKGWSGLILCMLWEEAKGPASQWAGYFAAMPTEFSTLMFWTPEELEDLKGSCITEKIGKEDVEREYHDRVLPAVKARPDLFPPAQAENYTLERFHVAGSRILSRSFTVHDLASDEEDEAGTEGEDPQDKNDQSREEASTAVVQPDGDVEMSEATNVQKEEEEEEEEEEDSSDDEEDEYSTTLVPLADMLNARTGCNNARLYHEKDCLRMCAIEVIPAGSQIWNTYGDCPNEDLLRRYGFVDLVPLPDGTMGNPADIAEVKADLLVKIAIADFGASEESSRERIDWWLDNGGDDVFDLGRNYNLPDVMTWFARLLLMPRDEWAKTQRKGKPPRGKPDAGTLALSLKVLRARLAEYPTTLEEDEALFPTLSPSTHWKKRNAVAVRLGEKRILTGTLRKCEEMEHALAVGGAGAAKPQKRRASHGAADASPKGRGGAAKRQRK